MEILGLPENIPAALKKVANTAIYDQQNLTPHRIQQTENQYQNLIANAKYNYQPVQTIPPIYPGNMMGYTNQQSIPITNQDTFAGQSQQAYNEACTDCNQPKPDLYGLGGGIAQADGEDLSNPGRQMVNAWRPLPGFNKPPIGANPIYVTTPNLPKDKPSVITPLFSSYDANMYKTPYDRSENMVSTGFMTNPYSGRLYETFEKQLPPPNEKKDTFRSDQFSRTNPQLIRLQGGNDPNALPPSKREVLMDIPCADAGRNTWGSELYNSKIGQRIYEYVSGQVFNNRNGDYSTEQVPAKEAPAGFVGTVNAVRPLPYLPPTNRAILNNMWYTGISDPAFGSKTVDLPDRMVYRRKLQWKGNKNDKFDWLSTGNVSVEPGQAGAYIVSDFTLKNTLKQLAEMPMNYSGNVQPDVPTSYTVSQDPKTMILNTLKQTTELNTQGKYPIANEIISEPTTSVTYNPKLVRSSAWKQIMEMTNPGNTGYITSSAQGEYIPFQGDLKNGGTRRQFYSDQVVTLGPNNANPWGEYVPSQEYITLSNRNMFEDYRITDINHGPTLEQNIWQSTRDAPKKQSKGEVIGIPDLQNTIELTSDTWLPQYSLHKKRIDNYENECLSIRPNFYFE